MVGSAAPSPAVRWRSQAARVRLEVHPEVHRGVRGCGGGGDDARIPGGGGGGGARRVGHAAASS